VIIDIINVQCIAVREAEDHTPIGTDRYSPKTFELAFEPVQRESRQIHVGDRPGSIQTGQNISQFLHVLTGHASWVGISVKASQPFMADRQNQPTV
jgi:hypothetical protein